MRDIKLDLDQMPDATMVAEHSREGRPGDRPAGTEKVFADKCVGYLRHAWGLPTVADLHPPSDGVIDAHDGDRGETPNKRGLAMLWALLAAYAIGRGVAEARARVIAFFRKQRRPEGHQWAEGCTSSHGQLWPIIRAVARAIAVHYQDEELLAVTGEHYRCQAALDDVLLDPDGHRSSPNGRSSGANFDLGTIEAHMIRGTAPPEMSLIRGARGQERPLIGPNFWPSSYNVGIFIAQWLIQNGDTLGGATEGERAEVRLRWTLNVHRNGNQSVKEVPFAISSEFLFWCAQLNEKPDVECIETSPGRYEAPHVGGRFPQGKANPWPAPELRGEGWTTMIIPGVP